MDIIVIFIFSIGFKIIIGGSISSVSVLGPFVSETIGVCIQVP